MDGDVVFAVTVEVINNDDEFETVVTDLELREPVIYKDKVMRQALRDQYPRLYRKRLKGKSWTISNVEWRR